MIALLVILAIIIVIAIYGISIYNGLQCKKVRVDETWSQIDVQLKRRNDLIPNLVSTVKGYTKHEADVLTNITKARSGLLDARTCSEKAKYDSRLTQGIQSLIAVSENYPDLKANASYQQLISELTNTEDKISYARGLYNNTVSAYNEAIVVFPASVIAGVCHFSSADYFKVDESDRQAPKVEF